MYGMTDKSRTVESDRFFKSIPADWFESDSGHVESPTNWFGLVEIDDDFRATWPSAEVGQDIPASVENGLFLVSIDNNGLVWAEQADTDSATRANYAELCEQYAVWCDSDEEV